MCDTGRFKMCKEIGRWVEFFEEHSGENYSAVMTVPSWIKAVTMVNYEFEEYNEQHRVSIVVAYRGPLLGRSAAGSSDSFAAPSACRTVRCGSDMLCVPAPC